MAVPPHCVKRRTGREMRESSSGGSLVSRTRNQTNNFGTEALDDLLFAVSGSSGLDTASSGIQFG